MKNDENGYIVVETVGTFIPFVFLVISILSLVNIVTLQARVHNALTQTAGTLSMYSYVLYSTGTSESISSVFGGIESLSGGNGVGETGDFVQGLLNYGAGQVRSLASEQFVRPLFERYLQNGEINGSEYLRSVRVVNLNFNECTIIDGNENIKLTVDYEIEYTFGALKLPFGPTLKITQTAVTKAWLGGSGEGYW